MHKLYFTSLLSVLTLIGVSQVRLCNKDVIGKTYSYGSIYGSLKGLVDKPSKENYFNDEFFNDLLVKLLQDKKFSEKEKVQMFYLMQKKIGYAFAGASYLPPEQNYFASHQGKVYTYQKMSVSLKSAGVSPSPYLKIAETYRTSDAILSANALLLATLINPDSALKKLHTLSKDHVIKEAKNANIFNHYVCMSASLVQDSIVVKNLVKNLGSFTVNEWIEDDLCALYAKSNPLSLLKTYLMSEKNEKNGLAIQTALDVIIEKAPKASFENTVKSLRSIMSEKWKKDILGNMLDNKYQANYSLCNPKKVVTKVWDGVTVQSCPDGLLITNSALTEFDEN